MPNREPDLPRLPAYRLLTFPAPGESRPYVLVNMVMSADGRTVVEDSERGLGSPSDQRLMRELRAVADVVINGAATLRKSGTSSRLDDPALEHARSARGCPPVPLAAVFTNSGDLPLENDFFTARDFDGIVYSGADVPADCIAAIAKTGRRSVRMPRERPLAWALAHMRQTLGARVVVVEGGSAINGGLLDAELVDEFFLTLAPRIVGGRDGLPAVRSDRERTNDALRQLELLSAIPNTVTGEVYVRYRVRRDGGPGG